MPFRIAFMGSPDFAVGPLRALHEAGHEVAAVYCQPPRPAGRGQKERRCPVHDAAQALDIPVYTPKSFRDPSACESFAALDLEVAVVAAYGLILPKAVLDAPERGCINIHASLLPRWRGAAPIQRAILAGDDETGITIMQMDEGLDTGPMLLAKSSPITDKTTGESLHDALAEIGAAAIVEALDGLEKGTMTPTPQPETGSTYADKLDPAESRLDWARPAIDLERQVRAFTPWPGSWFDHEGARIKILQAALDERNGAPGAVLDDELTIACGAGSLRLLRLQRASKRALAAQDFLRGTRIAAGMRLT